MYLNFSSLRVNIDMAKTMYASFITRDKEITNTHVRSSTIPEELGRISYLLSDKTGTLTQNEMVFKRLHLGTVSFGIDSMDEIITHLKNSFPNENASNQLQQNSSQKTRNIMRRTIVTRVRDAVEALALCHNVTPVNTNEQQAIDSNFELFDNIKISYQASSPDEVIHFILEP
jgi:phospholipid-translocating ATPase